MSEQAARNGAVRIAFEERGAGEPLLLIQGLGYGRWGWAPVADLLAERFRVILFDNRGIGASDCPPGPYTTEQMAGDAAAVLDAAEVERAHVLGTSLGGMVAQELALSSPQRIDKLVLVCTTPGGADAYPLPERTLRLMAGAAALAPEVALRRFVENALAATVVESRPELVEEILALRLANPQPLECWQAQSMAALSFAGAGRLGEVEAPTLLVHGTADNVVDHRNSDLIADRIPGAQLEIFEGAGHLLFWEEPERFARLVTEFLENS
jgi:pimeloyl-ACP methyl ester carboxylesterase